MGTAFPTKLHGPPSVPLALKGYESPAAERLSPTKKDSIEAPRGHVLLAFEHPWRAPLNAIFFR